MRQSEILGQRIRLGLALERGRRAALFCACVGLAACANLNTVDRSTSLPSPSDDFGVSGKAIHLDAQQRLVLVNEDGVYCAEPSPDALAAYASSLGLGASAPSQGAISFAQALQSSAASIGLRTQSIQLMRDELYRVCEAYANGALTPMTATLLLSQSQDLMAVVVAIEQLTGAVVANQVALTSEASASASADLVANQQLLEQAREDEKAKQDTLTKAETARDGQKQKVDAQRLKVSTAEGKYNTATAPGSTVSQAERDKLETELNTERGTLEGEEAKLNEAEREVELRKQLLAEATKVRQTIEDAKNAALTRATAATSSAAEFSTPGQRKELSKDATEAIAGVVRDMVSQVLRQDYTVDACTSLLTDPRLSEELSLVQTRQLCIQMINARIQRETETIVLGEPVSRTLQTRKEAAAAYVRTLDQAQLDEVASMVQVPTGSDARINILRAIVAATTEQQFNAIAEQLRVTCGDPRACNF